MNPTATKKQNYRRGNLLIDTLALAESLEEVGVPANQARKHVQIVAEVFQNNISTKEDVAILRKDMELIRAELKEDIVVLRKDMELMRVELKKDIESLRSEMYQMKSSIIIWVAGMLVAQAGLIAALQKLL